jgi:hypothetical protein
MQVHIKKVFQASLSTEQETNNNEELTRADRFEQRIPISQTDFKQHYEALQEL